jgi:hypothetical protein
MKDSEGKISQILFLNLLLFCFSQPHAGENKSVEISGDLRSYFFQRDFKNGTTDQESFAVGGILRGRFHPYSAVTAGISLYTSQGASLNDSNKDVYNLLAKDPSGDHKNYTALGEAFLELHYNSFGFKLGRQEINTPWLNQHDVRMTPQSFDAASFKLNLNEDTDIHLCHVARMKYKTDTKAKSMSETAGFSGNEGVSCLGLEKSGELGLQFWGYRAHDMWDDLYLRMDYTPKDDDWYINARFLNRNSIGDKLAGNQDSWHAGLMGGITLGDFDLNAAYSRNGDHTILRKWGHATTISNQVMVADRAKEKAWLLGAKYSPPSLPMLKMGVSMANHDTPDSGTNQSPDRKEYNFDLQYSLDKAVPGLSLRGRYAWVDESGAGAKDLGDLRLYLRYQFKLD